MDINVLIPKLDFEILPVNDSSSIYVVDISDWKHLEGEITPYFEIKVPGAKEYVRNFINMHGVKVYRSDALNLTSNTEIDNLCDLPDGIYYGRLVACGGEDLVKEKMFLRYNVLQERIDKKITESNRKTMDNTDVFKKIYTYMEFMKSYARCSDAQGAMDYYARIEELLKHTI